MNNYESNYNISIFALNTFSGYTSLFDVTNFKTEITTNRLFCGMSKKEIRFMKLCGIKQQTNKCKKEFNIPKYNIFDIFENYNQFIFELIHLYEKIQTIYTFYNTKINLSECYFYLNNNITWMNKTLVTNFLCEKVKDMQEEYKYHFILDHYYSSLIYSLNNINNDNTNVNLSINNLTTDNLTTDNINNDNTNDDLIINNTNNNLIINNTNNNLIINNTNNSNFEHNNNIDFDYLNFKNLIMYG